MACKNKYKALRGMPDILPDNVRFMRILEEIINEVFSVHGFNEIRTPILEETEVFTRSIGTDTDIVEKEMYSFLDRGGKNISMRPEGTASIIRAYIENGWVNDSDITKLFYYGPMFRGERPQKGRLRQFYQAGVEIIGASNPYIDAELLSCLDTLLKKLKIKDHTILINSLGCKDDRSRFENILSDYLSSKEDDLCENCRRRAKTNVLRVLDCKKKQCKEAIKNAPLVTDTLCPSCLENFNSVKSILTDSNIQYKEKKDLVRGLDYYTGVVFEVVCGTLGAQDAVAAGGRYDDLCREMGGPDTGATGFALGMERLLLVMDKERYLEKRKEGIFVVLMDKDLLEYGFKLVRELRENDIISEWDPTAKSFRSQMRKANKQKWKHVIVIGEDEIKSGELSLKEMETGKQQKLKMNNIIKKLRKERKK